MLRIHFTADDLQNIRLAREPDPLWEIVCSLCRLQTGQGPLEFGHWRRSARHRVRRDAPLRDSLRRLGTLVPSFGYIPDFLTPPVTGAALPEELDLLRATPRPHLTRDLDRLAESRALPGWTAALGGPGGGAELTLLTDAFADYFRTLLEPHWTEVRAVVRDDIGRRTRALLDGGTRALLEGLRPFAHWNSPLLEVDYPVDRDLHLQGRGLLLVPSYFCWRRPTAPADAEQPPVLVFPATRSPLILAHASEGGTARLLGRSRAAVLAEVVGRGGGRTTSEIATAVGLALSSASHQLDILRDGGLVTSRRDGKYVLHSATSLGLRILHAGTRETAARTRETAAAPERDRGLRAHDTAGRGTASHKT
ncbi:helix-turn-helix domain-containing protein [Streptomyces sp. p1417]|uniref:Helix-turn-helix domain-containing protein n=1 Tax=Streptomyces typhae TaxID=2681492 RepID=A0A6L6X3Y4_9ACTN|nr:helix-turn-helix domain-containing protein [Streptomyces typhae]MVO88554.1 helix-turn-helix domain-containing protein [Streptomyces typhae]